MLLTFDDLRARGIPLSAKQLHRLESAGSFPKRVRVSEHRIAWVESEIDRWIAERAAERVPS
jgi:prophage regulatory protein